MAISFRKYVNINSSVGGGAGVAVRELIGRLFTTNTLLPSGSYIEFSSLDEVGDYFGTSSDEYLRAGFYFGWINKVNQSPKKISYARWVDADQAPMIYGAVLTASLDDLKAVTTGAFSMTLGGTTNVMSGLDLSGAASFAAVAAILQAAIRTKTGTMWTAATVTYNAVRGSFDFVGGDDVAAVISVQAPGTGTDIKTLIGWYPEGDGNPTLAIWSDGSLAEEISDVLADSTESSDNFGSFAFIDSLTEDQIVEAATWNAAQNLMFQYCAPVSAANASTYSAALIGLRGVSLTLAPLSTEYPEMCPMLILAATNYNHANSTQNYMFQVFNLTPSVTTTADADTYDSLRVNYYGQTQSAGQNISFYQDGYLMGLTTDPVDMNTYANEQWLKSSIVSQVLQAFIANPEIPANESGRSTLITLLQSGSIASALNNGTISVGGFLTTQQKVYIENITNDPNAWYQVQNIGYWFDAVIESYVEFSLTKYKVNFTLVYKKDDVVRKVEGDDILI